MYICMNIKATAKHFIIGSIANVCVTEGSTALSSEKPVKVGQGRIKVIWKELKLLRFVAKSLKCGGRK